MKQNTRMWVDGNEVEIPELMCCSRKCDGTVSHPLVYDGDHDGTPDNVSSDGNTITITPTDLSVGECDNDVVYALQNAITGVSINSTNAVISIDCGIASQESCDLMILIDTLCDGTVIGTRSMNIVLTCGECDEDTETHLTYDADGDGVPDIVTESPDNILVIPTDVSSGQCDSAVTYAFAEDYGDGFYISPSSGIFHAYCNNMDPEDCGRTLVINTLCDGNVVDSVEVVAPTKSCEKCTENNILDYDGDDDGIPDNITSNNTTVTVTPIELQTYGCENGVITYVLNPEETPEGATIDENTAVISIDCQLIATANADCSVTLDVYPRCDGEYIVINGVEQHTIINVPLRDYCTSECGFQETQLDYDGNNDGVPDTVTVDGDIITVTPIEVSSGECPSDVTYEFAEDYGEGFVLNSTTGVVTIDCTKVHKTDCGKEIVVNTMCQGNLVTHATFNAPTGNCTECTQNTQLDYDSDDDGVPDTVTIDGNIITITPVELNTGNCQAPNHIVYSLASDVSGVSIDPATAVITIDCSATGDNVCELDLTINTECVA